MSISETWNKTVRTSNSETGQLQKKLTPEKIKKTVRTNFQIQDS